MSSVTLAAIRNRVGAPVQLDTDGIVSTATERRTAWLMVLGQFVLLGLIVGLPGARDWTLPLDVARGCIVASVIGVLVMVVAATALGRGLSAAPLPNEHTRLRTTGLYRYVRHPIYTGLLLFAIAFSVRSGSGWVAAACVLLVVLINVKARWEERHLKERFPDYVAYARRTARFIPSPKVPTRRLRAL
jgi:protein-S-isoprenylcysteine O-methyltransferase Ste14